MDFLCPSCQKMLTVPDQYAGTLMKCPLCQNTFTAPALPPKPAPLSAVPPAPPPPPPADTYGVQAEASSSGPPKLAAPPPVSNRTPPKPPPLSPSANTEVHTGFTIPFSPQVLPWVAPVALVLVFVLQIFFPWVGSYWTGTGMLTQGAWGAAFGYYGTPDQKLWETVSGLTPKDVVGMNLLLLPYLLLFLLALVLAVASAVLPHAHQIRLPPAADPFRHYRWGLTAVVAFFSLLILCAVLILGFTMEHKAYAAAQQKANEQTVSSDAEKAQVVGREYKALGVTRTSWMALAFVLQLIAVLAAALSFWLDYRGPARSVPRLEMRW